jgi:hypothetical protein
VNSSQLFLVCFVGLLIASCKPPPIVSADYAKYFPLDGLSKSKMTEVVDERAAHGVARFTFLVSPKEYTALVKSAISNGYSQPVERGGSFGTFDETASNDNPIWMMKNRRGKTSKFIYYKKSKNEVTIIIFWD